MLRNLERSGLKRMILELLKLESLLERLELMRFPQLFNILKGDMSIIGPRPERPSFTEEFNQEIPGFINRLAVKPGLTGLGSSKWRI